MSVKSFLQEHVPRYYILLVTYTILIPESSPYNEAVGSFSLWRIKNF